MADETFSGTITSGPQGPFDPVQFFNQNEYQSNQKNKDDYLAKCQQWVTENTRNRELGLPLTIKPAIPKKKIWVREGNMVKELFVDFEPQLKEPELPPVPATIPPGPTFPNPSNLTLYEQESLKALNDIREYTIKIYNLFANIKKG